jgi:hypothetical protein
MYSTILKNDSIFKDNKYMKIYLSLISHAQNRNVFLEYSEKHHVLPKCIYPQYKNLNLNQWNAAKLTAREHFIAHKLLLKFANENTNEYYKLLSAFACMITSKKRILSSREYDECRKTFSKVLSLKRKGKTYEEIYGEETAANLKKIKSEKPATTKTATTATT